MARVAKDARTYFASLEYWIKGELKKFTREEGPSLPKLLRRFFVYDDGIFPQADDVTAIKSSFRAAGGEWPAPNFHTVARDLRLAPHEYDRGFDATAEPEEVVLRVRITVADTSSRAPAIKGLS
jgi:hypothetical protein